MNTQDYISSGIIETYALGAANEQEARELELLCTQYPEIRDALRAYQETVELYANQHVVKPPQALKQNIWEAVQADEKNAGNNNNTQTTPSTQNTPSQISLAERSVLRKSIMLWKYTAAASIALFIASGIYNFSLLQTNKKTESAFVSLQQQQQLSLANQQRTDEALSILMKPTTKMVVLDGVGSHLNNKAMLYWDNSNGDVFLNLNSMPKAPKGKQYQLWAIVDGKPVDAGMYDPISEAPIHKMKTITRAEMFAITIEQKGGSASPTMDQMVVAGKAI